MVLIIELRNGSQETTATKHNKSYWSRQNSPKSTERSCAGDIGTPHKPVQQITANPKSTTYMENGTHYTNLQEGICG